ncbi:Cathepsin E-B [Psilocybe cubensis]|uniref:Cathepsin E-B n=2 Tax=Psilocybe cubensis TaxID=181762 RepID=A0ACB8GK63_PSICU|nr:Cathepsin E-B [Psilocybe cubensis]KAH9476110.1 Cathepsin E-B [Psilocybe cubensis]
MKHALFSFCILLALRDVAGGPNPAITPRSELSLDEIARRYTRRTEHGLHLPIVRTSSPSLERRAGATAAIGLGDFIDVTYSVLLTIGAITTPLILDTGSSDLWVMSDACSVGCTGGVGVYPQSSFRYAGVDVALLYGDSTTGTFAQGVIGEDTVDLAGLTLDNQFFAAINRTNTSIAQAGSAGIFGLGFPVNSVIWNNLFTAGAEGSEEKSSKQKRQDEPVYPATHPTIKLGSPFPSFDLRMPKFPSLPATLGEAPARHGTRQTAPRQTTSNRMYNVFASYKTIAPFLPRLVANSVLERPMFSVTLQRDTVDIGGNVGMLSIGELPEGVQNENMTWVPLREYTSSEGGLPAPPDAPEEVYPITWEVMLDGVFFDGELLPLSSLSDSSIQLSALIDTGNSLIRGPADVIDQIQKKLGVNGLFPCSIPHTLAFKIGGQMFPVDPRDFVSQAFQNNVKTCSSNLVATDAPSVGGYQFGWSLGTPFLKGVLSAYYYGNLTYPSQDPPKMGFLSTVPTDADQRLRDAVAAAAKADDNFPAITESAPSGAAKHVPTNSNGIAQSTATGGSHASNGASNAARIYGLLSSSWFSTGMSILFALSFSSTSTALSI